MKWFGLLCLGLAMSAGGHAATARADGTLEALCAMMCGSWQSPDDGSGRGAIRFDLAAQPDGTLQGHRQEMRAGGAKARITIELDPAGGRLRYTVEEAGREPRADPAMLDGGELTIWGDVLDKPDLTSIVRFTWPRPGTMEEMHAESGERYNNQLDLIVYERIDPSAAPQP